MIKERKANLFLVGAMKAGTTSFNDLLKQHKSIYFSPIKEPNYFVNILPKSIYDPSRFFSLDKYFSNDFPKELHIAKLSKKEDYNKLFQHSTNKYKYLAEGSTTYFHAKESPELIYNYNPNAKIIILLRDPLKRAFSHYKMDLGLGRTNKSFQKEIDENLIDYNNNKLNTWSYLAMSIYKENILHYKSIFKENVLIINFEDLIKDKSYTLKRVFNFLEIEELDLDIPHSNNTSTIRFQKTLYFFKKIGIKDFFSKLFPKRIKQIIFNKISSDRKLNMNLNKETIKKLNSIFDYKINQA